MQRTFAAFLSIALAACCSQQVTSSNSGFLSAIAALNSGKVGSLQLSGTFDAPYGDDASDSGSFSAQCSLSGSSQFQTQSSVGLHRESRRIVSGVATGSWTDDQGATHRLAPHNVQTPASWLCPQVALAEILLSRALTVRYIGNESKNGIGALHYSVLSSSTDVQAPLSTSTDPAQMEIYLDAASFKPIAFDFNTHPDNNALINIPVEIQFENYFESGGVLIPGTVKKYMNASLAMTIQVATATQSTSLSDVN
jgi:hypothetical protein